MPDSQVQLVITVPEPYGAALAHRMRCRMTLGVLTQLLAQSKRYIVIAAPFMQVGYGLSDGPLADALKAALQRGVNVDIVSTGRGLQTIDVAWLRQGAQGNLRLLQPRANILDDQRLGSHAKFCVVDGLSAYVGSANLTGPGLGRNLEMGLLVQGEVARQIEEFWEYSLEIELFTVIH